MKPKVYIDGKEGTTGLQIYDRLARRQDIELLLIDEDKRKDVEERRRLLNAADLVFLCLPDQAAREAVSLVTNDHTRIIDASTAHRTAPGWDYGFPELSAARRAAIVKSRRVANPGCHATGFISIVAPLVQARVLPAEADLSCFSLTGYSGGGKKMIAQYEAEDRGALLSSPALYALTQGHKHLPEMQAVCGLAAPPAFVPVVADYYCGMQTILPLHMALAKAPAGELARALAGYYAGQSQITVHPLGEVPENGFLASNALAGSDRLEIYCTASPDGSQMLLAALFDNLGKGASGAAVQCMNLMLGLPETAGLE